MTARWSEPEITLSRPPARRPIDWDRVFLLAVLLGLWAVILVVLFYVGVI